MRSSTLDAACMGVTYVQVRIEKKSDCSSPSFHARLQAIVYDWSRQTGWPRLVRYEQETHDRGVSSSILIKNGVMIRTVGKETQEQIRSIGRRGDIPKKTMRKATKKTHVAGVESKDMILGDCLSNFRAKADESFVRWDLDERLRRAALAKGRTCGWILPSWRHSFVLQKKPRAGEHGSRWNGSSRLVRFEKDKNSLSETQPRDSIFVRIAIDRLRPRTTAELLVYHCMQAKGSTPLAAEAQTQRGFTEEHTPLAEPPRTVDDDRDDEVSEPTQTMKAEKAKGGRDNKRVTGTFTHNYFLSCKFITT